MAPGAKRRNRRRHDENEKGRADAVRKLKAKAGYADYKEMLAKKKPQVASVADRWR